MHLHFLELAVAGTSNFLAHHYLQNHQSGHVAHDSRVLPRCLHWKKTQRQLSFTNNTRQFNMILAMGEIKAPIITTIFLHTNNFNRVDAKNSVLNLYCLIFYAQFNVILEMFIVHKIDPDRCFIAQKLKFILLEWFLDKRTLFLLIFLFNASLLIELFHFSWLLCLSRRKLNW